MALHFNSKIYNGTGQTSTTFFSQHHQLPCFIWKIFPTLILFFQDYTLLNKFPMICQEIFYKTFYELWG